MNKIYYVAYRSPAFYKYAADTSKSDENKAKDTTPKSDSDTTSSPSTEKKYTKEEFDALLANYAKSRVGSNPVGVNAIYDNELKKRRSKMNVLDSRAHNSYLRATGYNPKMVFAGALAGYGAGALASKLLGLEADGAWYDAAHRSRWFGGPSGAPSSGKGSWHIPTSIGDAMSMVMSNVNKEDNKEENDKFFSTLSAIDSKLDEAGRKYLLEQAATHGYAMSGKEVTDIDGKPAIEVTFADGSIAKLKSDPASHKYSYGISTHKNPYRWLGYGLRGLGFVLGGAIPYLGSKAVELPYDATTYAYNRYIR